MISANLDTLEPATAECVKRAWHAYMTTALWSSTDDNDEPLDSQFDVDDISFGSQENMLADVYAFLEGCWDAELDLGPLEPEQIGHDFWLTRNHHGAGFWDRGLGELGDRLTEMSHPFGDAYLWVGDDGRVYYSE